MEPRRARDWRSVDLVLQGGACLLCGLVLLELFSGWADPDEMEHAHAAWLLAQGQIPYIDFFESHLPGLWRLLRPFYTAFPTGGPGVLFWGRGIAALALFGSTYCIFDIAERLHSRRCAWLALDIWLPFSIASRALQIRPEMPASICALASLWALRTRLLAPGHRPDSRWIAGSGLLCGLAMYFSPRTGFLAAGIFLTHLRELDMRQRCTWLTLAAAGPLAAVAEVGWHDLLKWIVHFNSHQGPPFSVWHALGLAPHGWILLAAAVLGLWSWIDHASARTRGLALIYGLGLAPVVFLEQLPYPQAFACIFPLAAILLARHLVALFEKSRAWAILGALELAVLAIWPAVQAKVLPGSFLHFEKSLFWQVQQKSYLCRRLRGECVLMPPPYHPIGLPDASFYWVGLEYLEKMRMPDMKHHFLSDFQERRPILVFVPYIELMSRMEPDSGLREFIQRRYRPFSKDFLCRKDSASTLDLPEPQDSAGKKLK